MTAEAPFPITNELLRAHPVYRRAQAILTAWHRSVLNDGPLPEKQWRQEHLEALDMIDGKREPKSDWYWPTERQMIAQWLLFECLRCTYHDEPEERMASWNALQRAVSKWDEKFANDTDVA